MIPNNKITSKYVDGEFIYENSEEDLIDIHPGGLDIQNIDESPTYQMWEMYYENNIIKLKSLTNNKIYNIRSIEKIEQLSFSFTLNMVLNYLYTKSDKTYLTYYDTLTQKTVEVVYENMGHPKLVYDDLRTTQSNSSDILLVYINNLTNKLCYRLLRDRYAKEYELYSVPKHTRLIRVGMADNLRLKFKLQAFN